MSPAVGTAGPTNWVDLVVRATNALCIDLAAGERGAHRTPEFKARAIEAGKLKRYAEKYEWTLDDLALALDYVVEHKIDLKSPAGLVFFAGLARKRAFLATRAADVASSTGSSDAAELTSFEWAIDREAQRARDGDDRAQYWLRRFQRASGHARKDVLNEWAEERGGLK